jgi:alpha-ribazole phosphatase/probable phosphoglycerate mutase
MTDLLLIRHAETDMAGTFCGHSDPPVNAAGRQQIVSLVESLRTKRFDAVYTSDLVRASATANALAGAFTVPCFPRPALREIKFGRWEGLTWSEIEAADPTYAAEWLKAFPNLPAPGGEAFEAFEVRVRNEATDLLSQPQHRSIAVVTHAGVIRTILRAFCGINDQQAAEITKTYCSTYACKQSTAKAVHS